MKHRNTTIVTAAMLAGSVATARAERPPLDEVESAVRKLQGALIANGDDAKAPHPDVAAEILAAPFSYAGFEYSSIDRTAMKACKRRWGAAGKVTAAAVPAFIDCMAIALWAGALDGEADWSEAKPGQLPKQLKKYKSKLAKLAKDHAVVISHFKPAGPVEEWNIYAATKDATGIHLDTLIAVNVRDAE